MTDRVWRWPVYFRCWDCGALHAALGLRAWDKGER